MCGLRLGILLTGALVGNLKAVEYRLPLGVGVSIPGAEEDLLSDGGGDMIA